MTQNPSSNRNSSITVTDEQREVLYGILLGDASLKTLTEGRTYALHVEHTMEDTSRTSPDKSSYVLHLYNLFSCWGNPGSVPEVSTASLGRKLGFTTVVQDSLRYYGKQFYRDATDEEKNSTGAKKKLLFIKKVPDDIHKHLTDRTLAYWYMDDGSLKGNDRPGKVLNTQGFTKKEVERLSAALLTVGIKANVNKDKKYYKLYIPVGADREFTERIRPYVLPVFNYKLDALNAQRREDV